MILTFRNWEKSELGKLCNEKFDDRLRNGFGTLGKFRETMHDFREEG